MTRRRDVVTAPSRTARRTAIALAVVALGWVTITALWPSPPPKVVYTGYADKVQHGVVWLVLALALWPLARCWRVQGPERPTSGRSRALAVWATLTLYGVAIELAQMLVPHRSAELGDALADALGAALGCGVMLIGEKVHGLGRARRSAARQDAELQGLDPGSGAQDAAQQPRPGGGGAA